MLEADDSGFGHAVCLYYQARSAYRYAVSVANEDRDLTLASAENMARCARALLDFSDPLGGAEHLKAQLDWTDAKVAQLGRWAAGTEEQLQAALDAALAAGRILKPSLISSD
jgi:hypothetical protein